MGVGEETGNAKLKFWKAGRKSRLILDWNAFLKFVDSIMIIRKYFHTVITYNKVII